MVAMRSNKGSVAPFTAASLTCFSCSGVRPKLQVTVLLLTPRPAGKEQGTAAEVLAAVATLGHTPASPTARLTVIPATRIAVITATWCQEQPVAAAHYISKAALS